MEKRIKDTYQKQLWFFISFNIAVFWVLLFYQDFAFENVQEKFEALIDPKAMIFILSPIITLVLNGFLNSTIKEMLVFWKIKERLPGHRAFSHFAITDPRINVSNLKTKIGEFPNNSVDENRKWYQIYKKHQDDPIIMGCHRDYLLTRDISCLSFLFLFINGLIFIFYSKNYVYIISYLLFLIVQYLVSSIAARNYAYRFVTNVLSVESLT